MEKEFFENALKQKRYQNTTMGTPKNSTAKDELKGQSSYPCTNVESVVASIAGEGQASSNRVEIF